MSGNQRPGIYVVSVARYTRVHSTAARDILFSASLFLFFSSRLSLDYLTIPLYRYTYRGPLSHVTCDPIVTLIHFFFVRIRLIEPLNNFVIERERSIATRLLVTKRFSRTLTQTGAIVVETPRDRLVFERRRDTFVIVTDGAISNGGHLYAMCNFSKLTDIPSPLPPPLPPVLSIPR